MSFRRPRKAPPPSPLPPLLQRELEAAKQMVDAGVELTLEDAIETCIKYSGDGPFTPSEVELLRAQK